MPEQTTFPSVPSSYGVGEALQLVDGALTKCTGATTPEYICVQKKVTTATDELLTVIAVDGHTVYKTIISGDPASVNVGDKVTVSADALGVTAVKENGVAKIVRIAGTETGCPVYVKFI